MRLVVASAIAAAIGVTLLVADLRWFRRRSLTERLRPYAPGAGAPGSGAGGLLSVSSFREVIGPLASGVGGRLARIAGVDEALTTRLRRIHSDADATAFRVRQLGWTAAGTGFGVVFAVAVGVPAALGLVFAVAGAALAFLAVEQQLARRSSNWQRRVFLELPVVAEQLGMLLSAGYSLGAALNRIGTRGAGAVGQDLRRVTARVRQGLSEVDALREWAELVDVDAVDRLVAVLALNREAGDLGRLISEEARSIRREVQRELIETIERRAQQVWIPVTVATLVPGVMFLAVPFIEALQVFSEG
jgi:Flp pilus assembly protein TadB